MTPTMSPPGGQTIGVQGIPRYNRYRVIARHGTTRLDCTLLYRNLYVNLNSFNTILKRSIRIAKRMYYESRFGKCKNHIRKTWKLINDILSKTKKQPSQKCFKEGENIINDKAEIAHKFNNFFYKYWAKSCKYDK